MKTLIIAIVFVFSFSPAVADEFTAVVSCGMNGNNINVRACFDGTDLRIKKNGSGRVYKIHNIQQAGQMRGDGLHVDLPENFEIHAQNSEDTLILGIKVYDSDGDLVFDDEAGQYQAIRISN